MSLGDRVTLAVVALALVALAVANGPSEIGPLAQIGAFLLAFWLALRTLASERPRLHVYESNIVQLVHDWDAKIIGALVDVKLINLARAANAIARVEISLTRKGTGNVFLAEGAPWRKVGDEVELHFGPNIGWAAAQAEPTSLPFTIPALEAARIFFFVQVPATYDRRPGLYSDQEWLAMGFGEAKFLEGALYPYASVVDVHGRGYQQKDELARSEHSRARLIYYKVRHRARGARTSLRKAASPVRAYVGKSVSKARSSLPAQASDAVTSLRREVPNLRARVGRKIRRG